MEKEYKCPNCGCNIFDKGIYEVTTGGVSTTKIIFGDKVEVGPTLITNFEDEHFTCVRCDGDIMDITATELIDIYNQIK